MITCPPYGICVPVEVEKVHDGDTVYVRLSDPTTKENGLTVWHVRLIDCWAPEVNRAEQRAEGLRAKDYLERLLGGSDEQLSLFVPFPPGTSLIKLTTMGRLLGRLFLGRRDVSTLMVEAGFATKEKTPNDN